MSKGHNRQVKTRFSSLDVCAMAQSLTPLVAGYRIANVYDVNPKTYVLKLAKPDSPKLLLLIESGVRFHLTQYARDKGDTPSGFTMKLRKHLKSKRIEEISQVASDRVVVFGCGSGEARHHLIVELYDKGNVVLTDAEHNILTLLRSSKHDADARVTVRDKYPLAASRSIQPVSHDWLAQQMASAEPAQYLHAFLSRTVPLGRELIEHALACADFEEGIKMGSRPWEMEAPFRALVDALTQAAALFGSAAAATAGQGATAGKEATTGPYPVQPVKEPGDGSPDVLLFQDIRDPVGIIVLRDAEDAQGQAAPQDAQEAKVGSGADDAGDGALFTEFAPYELRQFASRRLHRFAAFWEAVDEYYSKMEQRRVVDEVASRQAAAWKKVDKVKESQANRVTELLAKEEEDRRRGEMIELRAGEVDALLASVRAGLSRGMDWDALAELIDDAAKAGDQLAAMVVKLDLAKHSITIALEEEAEEATEEELTRPAAVLQLDVRQSAHANARAFYAQKKAAASKTAKTIAAAKGAVRSAETKATASVAAIKVSASIRALRGAYWFEKFAWFISSENLLVITGHDAQQIEMLVKRHLEPGDVYVHADVEGALPCVIKAHGTPAREIPPLTLSQAGSYVLCRSSAWTSRNVTSAWWVRHDQVLKTPPAGDRLPPGQFLVTGAKQYLPPTQLLMGFGVLFKVAPACVVAHLGERRVRTDLRSTAAEAAEAAEVPEEGSESERVAQEEEEPDGDEDEDLSVLSFGPGGKLRVGLVAARSKNEGRAHADAPPTEHQAPRVPTSKLASHADEFDEDGSDTEPDLPRAGDAVNGRSHRPRAQEDRVASDDGTVRDAEAVARARSAAKGTKPPSQPAPKSAAPLPAEMAGKAKRGQKSKLKKMKERYADQDEEERALMLGLLGSAGKSKQEAAREAFEREVQEKAARDAEKEERRRVNQERMVQRQQEQAESRIQQAARQNAGVEATDDLPDEVESGPAQANAELEELLEEPSIQALDPAQRSMLAVHDNLTALPGDDDQVLFAVPVCAPYSVLTGYKFRVKLTPGAQKKGKAARQAIGAFCSGAHNATDRERELLRAVTDDELVRQIIGNVKVVSSGAAAAASKSDRKARAADT